jgi:hypothetical protein
MTKPDLYTKIVLTVIAVCLVWLCVQQTSLTAPAYARDNAAANDVRVNNLSLDEVTGRRPAGEPPQVMAVKIVGLELPGGIPVTLAEAPMTPVTIVGVDVPSEWGPANTLPVTFPSNVNFPTTYERRRSR